MVHTFHVHADKYTLSQIEDLMKLLSSLKQTLAYKVEHPTITDTSIGVWLLCDQRCRYYIDNPSHLAHMLHKGFTYTFHIFEPVYKHPMYRR